LGVSYRGDTAEEKPILAAQSGGARTPAVKREILKNSARIGSKVAVTAGLQGKEVEAVYRRINSPRMNPVLRESTTHLCGRSNLIGGASHL